jgi:isopenicillin N synthase-like dioxygenase
MSAPLDQVPMLDVRAFRAGNRREFVAALGDAFERYGFVCVLGHDVDSALTEPLYRAARTLFALPSATKQRYVVSGTGGARGYTAFGIETAKDQTAPDLKEFWHVGRELQGAAPPGLLPNVWPAEAPEFKPAALALWRALEALGRELLSAVALYLELPASWFDGAIDHGNSILRPLHYPPLAPAAAPGVRSAAHEDINLITLLVGSGEPGLQILRRDGSWLAVETRPGQVVVNVGDMLQRLTNHVLVSTTHRVVNPPPPWGERSRYSVPFFLHPNPELVIRSLPSCVSAQRPDRYPQAICADDYLRQRLREIGLL